VNFIFTSGIARCIVVLRPPHIERGWCVARGGRGAGRARLKRYSHRRRAASLSHSSAGPSRQQRGSALLCERDSDRDIKCVGSERDISVAAKMDQVQKWPECGGTPKKRLCEKTREEERYQSPDPRCPSCNLAPRARVRCVFEV
jgi:hypothetical protein